MASYDMVSAPPPERLGSLSHKQRCALHIARQVLIGVLGEFAGDHESLNQEVAWQNARSTVALLNEAINDAGVPEMPPMDTRYQVEFPRYGWNVFFYPETEADWSTVHSLQAKEDQVLDYDDAELRAIIAQLQAVRRYVVRDTAEAEAILKRAGPFMLTFSHLMQDAHSAWTSGWKRVLVPRLLRVSDDTPIGSVGHVENVVGAGAHGETGPGATVAQA